MKLCRYVEQEGECHNPRCIFFHPTTSHSRQPRICLTWERYGSCDHGSRCKFQHTALEVLPGLSEAPEASGTPTQAQQGDGARVCSYFQRTGQCNYGSNCCFSHDVVPENFAHAEVPEASGKVEFRQKIEKLKGMKKKAEVEEVGEPVVAVVKRKQWGEGEAEKEMPEKKKLATGKTQQLTVVLSPRKQHEKDKKLRVTVSSDPMSDSWAELKGLMDAKIR